MLPIHVEKNYSIGPSPLTSFLSMTLTRHLFTIVSMTIAFFLKFSMLPLLLLSLAPERCLRTWALITYQFYQLSLSLSGSSPQRTTPFLKFSESYMSFCREILLFSFPISSLARLGMKSRLSRSSQRDFSSTHPLMLSPTSPREVLFAYAPPWKLSFFTVECLLSSPCSRSDLPLSHQGAPLAHLDSLLPHNLVV